MKRILSVACTFLENDFIFQKMKTRWQDEEDYGDMIDVEFW